jgi:hypothetical protein
MREILRQAFMPLWYGIRNPWIWAEVLVWTAVIVWFVFWLAYCFS